MPGGIKKRRKAKELSDKNHLLKIFPAEVWVKIMDKIDPTDLANCSNASPFFRNYLLDARTNFLFPPVWALVEKHAYRKPKIKRSGSKIMDCLAARFTTHTDLFDPDPVDGGAKKILKLRLVCTGWRSCIDEYYQTGLLSEGGYQLVYGDWMQLLVQTDQYNRAGRAAEFISDFTEYFGDVLLRYNVEETEPGYCPILGRIVIVNYQGGVGKQEGPDAVLSHIFQNCGPCINKLSITYDNDNCMYSHYRKLQEHLSFLTNLKILEITVRNARANPDGDAQLVEDMREAPIVKMKQLSSLHINALPLPFLEHLVRTHDRLTFLTAVKKLSFSGYDFYSVSLTQLMYLELWYVNRKEWEGLVRCDFGRALEKLELSLSVTLPTQTLFSVMGSKWGKTLKSLWLHLNDTEDKTEECRILQKEFLPRVTHLRVDTMMLHELKLLCT